MSTQTSAPQRAPLRVVHEARTTAPAILLYEITPERHHKLIVVSPQLYSIWVHQAAHRALPCYADRDSECEHHRLPRKQQHYLFVEVPGNPTLRLLRLTSGLVYDVMPKLIEHGFNLNGLMLELWRAYASKKDSAMLGKIIKEECVDQVVRELPDIEWAVTRMLSASDRATRWVKPIHKERAHPTGAAAADFAAAAPELQAWFAQRKKVRETRGDAAAFDWAVANPPSEWILENFGSTTSAAGGVNA